MRTVLLIKLSLMIIIISSCGKGVVLVDNGSYEPKIVIDGLLVANHKVERIRVSRNFRIDTNLNRANVIPNVQTTHVTVTDVDDDKSYNLVFHVAADDLFENYYWEYKGDDLRVTSGKTYRLDVSAVIDGQRLSTSATTTVPNAGFRIADVNYPSLKYRQRDQDNNLINFELTIDRSPGTTFYLIVVEALECGGANYIYDNPYESDDNFSNFDYSWIQNVSPAAGQSSIVIWWNDFWFYTDYRIVVYAADENYEEFMQTFNDVQEDDGNFHEPKFNLEGDGIGIFGSVIADTVYVSVTRN